MPKELAPPLWRSVTSDTAVEMVSVGENSNEEYILWWRKMILQNGFVGPFTPNCVSTQDGVMVFGGINNHVDSGPVMNPIAHILRINCNMEQQYICDDVLPRGGLTRAWQPGVGKFDCGILLVGGRGMDDIDSSMSKGTNLGQWTTVGHMSKPRDQTASIVLTHHWDLYATQCNKKN